MAFFNTEGMGNSIAGGIGQFASNMFSSWWNNYQAEQRENRAREQNYKYNEKAAEQADKRQRAQYTDLYSPQAQMQQLQEAGLSPSIYASGGLAGKSGAGAIMGGGASGVSPSIYSAQPISALEAAQIGKLNAETKNIEVDTDNKEADKPNIIKQGNLIDAQVKDTLANAGYKEQAQKMSEIQTKLLSLSYEIEKWKKEEGITYEMIESEARTLYNNSMISEETLEQSKIQTKLDTKTFKDNVKYVSLQNANLVTDLFTKESQIVLNNTQAEALLENLMIDWYKAKVYKLSEQAKVIHMKNQIGVELKKLGVTAEIAQNENEIKVLTSILQSLTSIVTMSMLTNGGIKLRPQETKQETTQQGTPSLPYN